MLQSFVVSVLLEQTVPDIENGGDVARLQTEGSTVTVERLVVALEGAMASSDVFDGPQVGVVG